MHVRTAQPSSLRRLIEAQRSSARLSAAQCSTRSLFVAKKDGPHGQKRTVPMGRPALPLPLPLAPTVAFSPHFAYFYYFVALVAAWATLFAFRPTENALPCALLYYLCRVRVALITPRPPTATTTPLGYARICFKRHTPPPLSTHQHQRRRQPRRQHRHQPRHQH